jgi:hypothetical protein
VVKNWVLVFGMMTVTSCSTLSTGARVIGGGLVGAAVGGAGGAALSPNDESRALNALVFGLSGAILGGGIALWTAPAIQQPALGPNLRTRELAAPTGATDYLVQPKQELPDFLKRRVQPVVIEEFVEKDSVSEDGTLREPHKAYRIKRPAELLADPAAPDDPKPGGP